VVGDGEVAVVDAGPASEEHAAAVLAAVESRGDRVTHLLVTHTHADHSPATALLQERTGATTYGFGPHPAAAVAPSEAGLSEAGVEEHGDLDFVPDVAVRHGDVIEAPSFRFECLHTPGHISNHVCYAERTRGLLFTGDHVMGWSTTVITPPDGRIADYLASLRLLLDREESTYLPTHGPLIEEPRAFVASLIEHRLERERQVLDQLARGPRTVEALVEVMYADVHLIALEEASAVVELADGRFSLRDRGSPL
jgi:glyoxylase-like metal-dependent hydrolase (beta-lactamase superfamily II)